MRSSIFALVAVLALGCAGQSWERAQAEDTPAAYRHFLADHPGSSHAAEARERLDYLQAKREGTQAALDHFRSEHPQSAFLAELETTAASRDFEAARAEGTAEGYERFASRFPGTDLAERALGNAEYLRHGGFSGPDALAAFAQHHPTSDYAAEAIRTLSMLKLRNTGGFASVGLRIEVAPGVADADRLRNAFTERAKKAYADAGVPLVLSGSPAGWVQIEHSERPVPTQVYQGQVAGPGILAETQVSLRRVGQKEPIWTETFTLRVRDIERRSGSSVLFTASAPPYWSHFFVPVASWPTQAALRDPLPLRNGVVAVSAQLDRAVALFADGSFREVDLADPNAPRGVLDYARPAGLARFSGIRLLDDRVVVYGEDGVEMIARDARARRLRALARAEVGGVSAIETVGAQLLIAGSRGLQRTPLAGGPVEPLVPRPLHGIARAGGTLYALDDRMLYAAPVDDPRAERFDSAFEVGRALEPRSLSIDEGVAVIVGKKGVLCLDVSRPGAVTQLSRFNATDVGQISDAMVLGGRLFAVGERGLQVFDPRSGRLLDSVDVDGRIALDGAGRHVVVIGSDRLQVVDATPWAGSRAAASMAR
ncbi:MAG TPA: hypothetical protein VMH82_16450 [Myxococcota bacterium]|nr:hypothetical protein [Myxococcota bacterium]